MSTIEAETTVLAAIDDSTAAEPVLVVAEHLAAVLGTSVEAVHVQEGDKHTAVSVAGRHRVALRVLEGEPIAEIADAAADPSVLVVVVGARGQPSGPRPVGHIALELVQHLERPVLVVPPDVYPDDGRPVIRRVLVPLEGTRRDSDAVIRLIRRFCASGIELVAVHVFDASNAPAFWDESGHAEQSWADAFLSRWCDEADIDLHLRRGVPPEAILDVAESEHVDLIALNWSQDLSAGHAAVIRAALTHATVPVLLLPAPPR